MDKQELGLNMAKTFKALGGKIGRYIKSHGVDLPMEQFIVLDLLNQHNNLIQQELAELLNKDKSGILRIIDSLEKKGYVIRVPDSIDRRKKHLVVTKEGLNIYQEVLKLEGDVLSEALNDISQEDLEIFSRCISTIQKNTWQS